MKKLLVLMTIFMLPFTLSHAQTTPVQNQIQKITADPSAPPTPGEVFGQDIAISGNTMVISAIYSNVSDPIGGVLYVYDYDNTLGEWQYTVMLAAPSTGSFRAELGQVDIDGDIIVAGAMGVDDTAQDEGRVYIFERTGSTWALGQTLIAPEFDFEGFFGSAVTVQGDTLVVGASGINGGSTNGRGKAFVYRKVGAAWQLSQTLEGESPGDYFGSDIDLENGVLAIGARQAGISATTVNGRVYIYQDSGVEFVESEVVTPADQTGLDLFSVGLDLNSTGTVLSVGAARSNGWTGRVYVYRFNGTNWVEDPVIVPTDVAPQDLFGFDTAIQGNSLIAGSTRSSEYDTWAGKVYMYEFDGTSWTFKTVLVGNDLGANDFFGASMAMEGNFIAIAGSYDDNELGTDSGAVYMFSGYDGCRVVAPLSVPENQSFDMNVSCSDVAEPVFGFEFAHSIDPTSPTIEPQSSSYDEGSIFAGKNATPWFNDLIDGYAMSLLGDETPTQVDGTASLGSIAYDTDEPGLVTVNLPPVILGDVDGNQITVTTNNTRVIEILNLPLAAVSGTATRETGADTGAAITITIDGVPPPEDRVENGVYYFAYPETVALNAELIGDAPGHLECVTPNLGLTDEIENVLLLITLKAGDVDNDGDIDIVDATIIVSERFGDPVPADSVADLNEDEVINILDLIHVGRNYDDVVGDCFSS